MNIEKISNILKIYIDGDFYVLVIPDKKKNEAHYDFWLFREDCSAANFMFCCQVWSETEMIEMVEECYNDHIDRFIEEHWNE